MTKKLRAIDLFCGIGGWSYGLRLAGIDVVASYEWWPAALATYNSNLNTKRKPTDIRQMNLSSLPSDIDIVIGSPPCTEFSFANKGGGGDLVEGLKDVIQFLRVVQHVKPRFWVMENVPRVADLVERGLADKKSPLYRFRNLGAQVRIINFAEYGLPQSRVRSLVGNIPFDALETYKDRAKVLTLGDVISALRARPIVKDPLWGAKLPSSSLTENEIEEPLDGEQLRMNRDAKSYHPVYNNMAFPDRLSVPSRTVTATCTRVSRESIIVPVLGEPRKYRRLTIRERATLQGFPITYQFYSPNYTDKVKTIGNAVPPPFAYLVASAIKGVPVSKLKPFSEVGKKLKPPRKKAPLTVPNGRGTVFPKNRTFRAAIPSLRFKSGMRFEFTNSFKKDNPQWQVRFFFGPSTDIQTLTLDDRLYKRVRQLKAVRSVRDDLDCQLVVLGKILKKTSPMKLQNAWCHKDEGVNPYVVVDSFGRFAKKIANGLDDKGAIKSLVSLLHEDTAGLAKMERHAPAVLSGLILGAWFNSSDWHKTERK